MLSIQGLYKVLKSIDQAESSEKTRSRAEDLA